MTRLLQVLQEQKQEEAVEQRFEAKLQTEIKQMKEKLKQDFAKEVGSLEVRFWNHRKVGEGGRYKLK